MHRMNNIKYVEKFAWDVHNTEYGSSCVVKFYPTGMWKTACLKLHDNPFAASSKVVTWIWTADKMKLVRIVLQSVITCVSKMCGWWS
jgi:hypothetical protein